MVLHHEIAASVPADRARNSDAQRGEEYRRSGRGLCRACGRHSGAAGPPRLEIINPVQTEVHKYLSGSDKLTGVVAVWAGDSLVVVVGA
jgi:hypothetical protein